MDGQYKSSTKTDFNYSKSKKFKNYRAQVNFKPRLTKVQRSHNQNSEREFATIIASVNMQSISVLNNCIGRVLPETEQVTANYGKISLYS